MSKNDSQIVKTSQKGQNESNYFKMSKNESKQVKISQWVKSSQNYSKRLKMRQFFTPVSLVPSLKGIALNFLNERYSLLAARLLQLA